MLAVMAMIGVRRSEPACASRFRIRLLAWYPSTPGIWQSMRMAAKWVRPIASRAFSPPTTTCAEYPRLFTACRTAVRFAGSSSTIRTGSPKVWRHATEASACMKGRNSRASTPTSSVTTTSSTTLSIIARTWILVHRLTMNCWTSPARHAARKSNTSCLRDLSAHYRRSFRGVGREGILHPIGNRLAIALGCDHRAGNRVSRRKMK